MCVFNIWDALSVRYPFRSELVNTGSHIICDLLPSSISPKWLFHSQLCNLSIFVKLPTSIIAWSTDMLLSASILTREGTHLMGILPVKTLAGTFSLVDQVAQGTLYVHRVVVRHITH